MGSQEAGAGWGDGKGGSAGLHRCCNAKCSVVRHVVVCCTIVAMLRVGVTVQHHLQQCIRHHAAISMCMELVLSQAPTADAGLLEPLSDELSL